MLKRLCQIPLKFRLHSSNYKWLRKEIQKRNSERKMRERKCWGDKGANGNKDNTTCFHAMLKNLNLTLQSQGKNKKKHLQICCIINITDNIGKKFVRRERTEDKYV